MMYRLFLVALSIPLAYCTKTDTQNHKDLTHAPLEGTAWELDYSKEIKGDTIINHLPPNWRRIKMYTKGRWVFTGYDFNKNEVAGMAGGTYILNGEEYTESIEFHYHAAFNGKTFHAKLKVDSAHLYQTGKVDSLTLEERWRRLD